MEHLHSKYDILLIFAILGGKVSEAMNKYFDRNFREYNVPVTSEQWPVMAYLWEHDGATQKELCRITMRTKTEMTRLITRMESGGLVVREQSAADHRANHIRLTPLARNIREKAWFVANKTLKATLRGLSEEERRNCQESLKIILHNIKD